MTVETAPGRDEDRLAELRRKVYDTAYLAGAIQRIAQVLSGEIMEGIGVRNGRRKQGR